MTGLPPPELLPELDHHWTMDEFMMQLAELRSDRESMQECIRKLSRYVPQGMLSPHLHDRVLLKEAMGLMDKPHSLEKMSVAEILKLCVVVIEDYVHGEQHDVGDDS